MATLTASRPTRRNHVNVSQTPAERRAHYRQNMMEDMISRMINMQKPQSQPQPQLPPNPREDNLDLLELLEPVATPSIFLPTPSITYNNPPQQQSLDLQDPFMMAGIFKTGLTPRTGLTPDANTEQSGGFDQSIWDHLPLEHTQSMAMGGSQNLSSSATSATNCTINDARSQTQTPQTSTQLPQGPVQKAPKKRGRKRKQLDEKMQIEKRKKFLERNRVAANRCRERQKTYVTSLEARQKEVLARNQYLLVEMEALSEEVNILKQLVHVECACSGSMLERNLRAKLSASGRNEEDIEEVIKKFRAVCLKGYTASTGVHIIGHDITVTSPSLLNVADEDVVGTGSVISARSSSMNIREERE